MIYLNALGLALFITGLVYISLEVKNLLNQVKNKIREGDNLSLEVSTLDNSYVKLNSEFQQLKKDFGASVKFIKEHEESIKKLKSLIVDYEFKLNERGNSQIAIRADISKLNSRLDTMDENRVKFSQSVDEAINKVWDKTLFMEEKLNEQSISKRKTSAKRSARRKIK